MRTYKTILALAAGLLIYACPAQHPMPVKEAADRPVGGPCEGCEALFEYGDRQLQATDTLPGFADNEPKLLVEGTVFNKDGVTPAIGIIVYIYHTGRNGIYQKKGDENGWGRRHGMYRGWVKTGPDGHYAFYTFRPAAYPDGSEPEHIHLTVKEPGLAPYYMDEYVFDDDPLLTEDARELLVGRGGSGIVLPQVRSGLLTVTRDLLLGRQIPDYPY